MTGYAFGASAAACAVAILLSIPHGYALLANFRRGTYELVEDEDDNDEAISRGKSSRSLPQRTCLVLVAAVGTAAALWSWNSARSTAGIIQFASWGIILFQEIVLATRRDPGERYNLGIYCALSSLATGIAIAFPYARILYNLNSLALSSGDALAAVQIVASLALLIVNLTLPRGPALYRNGRIVDAQDIVSFVNRYTFAWAYRTLSLATAKGKLDPEDLPLVGQDVRAQTLSDNFFADSKSVQWRKWFKLYWRDVVVQVTIQLCSGSVRFLPNVLLLTILRLFEDRDAGESNQLQLWLTALGLGMSMITSSWLISLRNFVADLKISLPVNEQLFAVVTKKAMGLKDIVLPVKRDSEDEDDQKEDDEDEKKPQTKDSIPNLLGVDVEKISDFIAWSHLLLDCAIEFTLTITFLVYLMGWEATVAGCAIPTLLTPLYYTITKQYSEKEQALMERRDEKTSSLTEMVRGIRQIKLSATETEWSEKIKTLRGKELEEQKGVFRLNIALTTIYTFGPICMSFLSLVAYSYLNGGLSPSTAFTALSLFENLQNILSVLPEVVTDLLNARVSLRRIARFLGLEDHKDDRNPGGGIAFKDATIAWPSSEQTESSFQLNDLNLEFPTNALSVISGQSGAGKSLLLHALIGEADVVKGALTVPSLQPTPVREGKWLVNGSIAYVSQDPWIENATIRDSILFGLHMVPARYEDVLAACALLPDLKTFAEGDKTDIGANGISLSGGQKWRLALARALYSRASILVLDDIFSAVDAHVGRHLFENALTGRLTDGRTRVLATHHVKMCLGGASYLVNLENGRAVGRNVNDSAVSSDTDTRASSPVPAVPSTRRHSVSSIKKFYEEEKRETGVIKGEVYKAYIKASGGYVSWSVIAVLLVSLLFLNLAIPYWVSIWTRSYESTDRALVIQDSRPVVVQVQKLDPRLVFYGSIYLGISVLSWALDIVCLIVILRGSLQASKTMFEQFTTAVIRAPLRFLDKTPVGQILNRFTSDFGILDSDLSLCLSYTLLPMINILEISVAAFATSPLVVGLGILSLLASWVVGRFYVTGAREAKRLESVAKSPIFDLVGSLLTGLPTIRAFRREEAYLTRMYDLIDTHCQALWHRRLFSCWVEFWLSLVGAIFVSSVTMSFVGIRTLDAPLAGFALSFALEMSSNIDWLLRQYSELEINSNAAERIVEYTNLETETQSGLDVPASWPTRGEIEVQDLSVGYAPGLPPVLKNLNLSIRAGERVGIVGRTGAGKSSFAMTLLRCLDIRSGSIHIDGIDTAKVKLHDLRSRVGIISQDPIVFGGTVREVLDPFDQHDDLELQSVLEKVALRAPNQHQHTNSDYSSPEPTTIPLSYPIAPSGKNLSQGQRQLLTLARALVSRPRILIRAEATASIDMESDRGIQRALREEITGCTLLVIAHRLSTIADFDRVVFLEQGEVVEMDTPGNLLRVAGGAFRGMVEGSGER